MGSARSRATSDGLEIVVRGEAGVDRIDARTGSQTEVERADTRTRLAECALALFLEKGFAATSVREIATEAGVTIPALYYHFGSKDGLLGSLVEGLVIDGETAIASLDGSADPGEALASYYDAVTAHLQVFRLVMVDPSVRSHDEAGHRLADQGSRFLALLVGDSPSRSELIRAHCALGAIRRPLRTNDVDMVADRDQILASAVAAFGASP